MLLSNISLENRLVNGSRGVITGFALHTLDKFLETAQTLSFFEKVRRMTVRDLTDYFNSRQVGGFISTPLVKFVSPSALAPSPYPILPVVWDAEIPTYFNYADGAPGRNTICVKRIQIPLVLAWAMTIHKTQGSSLDCVSVDISQSFAPGQAYVGLSRCRSPGNMQVVGGSKNLARALQTDSAVLKFYDNLEEKFAAQELKLEEDKAAELKLKEDVAAGLELREALVAKALKLDEDMAAEALNLDPGVVALHQKMEQKGADRRPADDEYDPTGGPETRKKRRIFECE